MNNFFIKANMTVSIKETLNSTFINIFFNSFFTYKNNLNELF